jgi:hypothetical protein
VHQQSLLAAIIAVASAAVREITVVVMPLDVACRLRQLGELMMTRDALPDPTPRGVEQAMARLPANGAWKNGEHYV